MIDQGMPVIGSGVDDDVHVVPFHQPAEIRVDHRHLGPVSELPGGGRGVRAVHVADGDDIAVSARIRGIAPPCPPQPTSATPGRSLGIGTFGTSWASSCWRSTNHSGSPVIAAIRLHFLRNARREMLNAGNGAAGADSRRWGLASWGLGC